MAKMKSLLKSIDTFKKITSGRHPQSGSKKQADNSKSMANMPADRKHIREDTQTEVNLKMEKSGQEMVPLFFYAERKSSYEPPKTAKDIKPTTIRGSLYGDSKDGYLKDDSVKWPVHGEYMLVSKDELANIDKEEESAGWKRHKVEAEHGPAFAYFYEKPLPADVKPIKEWKRESLEKVIDSAKSPSAVKDETGQLKPLYHGTLAVFPSFQNKHISKDQLNYGPGHYFAEDPSEASEYTKLDPYTERKYTEETAKPNVHKVFVNIKKPFDVHNNEHAQDLMRRGFGVTDYNEDHGVDNTPEDPFWVDHYNLIVDHLSHFGHVKGRWKEVSKAINKKLQELGYDGIVNREKKHWVAFKGSQVAHPHISSTHNRMHKTVGSPENLKMEKSEDKNWFDAGFTPGRIHTIPTSNIYAPPRSENPVHQERVDAYKNRKQDNYDKLITPGRAPIALHSGHNVDLPHYEKMTDEPHNPNFPKFYIMDGVHRTHAAIQSGKKEVDIKTGYRADYDHIPFAKSEGLDKALGDWKNTNQYEIYHLANPKDPNRFVVYAHDKTDGDIGYARFKAIDHQTKGRHLVPDEHLGDFSVRIDKAHRRQGLASAMYEHAEKVSGLKVHPSEMQSEAGEKLWSQPKRPFGKSEDLEKGSLQRRYKFDPRQVDPKDRKKVENWTYGEGTYQRDDTPRMEGNDRFRALQRLHALTPSRRNPETGEREFLLHRGQTIADISNQELGHGGKASFTPYPKKAAGFAIDPISELGGVGPDAFKEHGLEDHPVYSLLSDEDSHHNKKVIRQHFGNVYSTWVPESQIHSIPNQWGSAIYENENKAKGVPGPQYRRDEHEVIVDTHGLNYDSTKYDNIKHLQNAHEKHVNSVKGIPPKPAKLRLMKTESLEKVRHNPTTGSLEPESRDPEGMQHPEIEHYVKGTSVKTGKAPVWKYKPEIGQRHEAEMAQLLPSLQAKHPGKEGLISSLHQTLLKDPDRHVVTSGAKAPELRLRHLLGAAKNDPAYQIKDHPQGLEITAVRHARNRPSVGHSWVFNGKSLKFSGETPISSSTGGAGHAKQTQNASGPVHSSTGGKQIGPVGKFVTSGKGSLAKGDLRPGTASMELDPSNGHAPRSDSSDISFRSQLLRKAMAIFMKSVHKDLIPGGLADKKSPKDFNQKALSQGKKVESEHTSDPAIAQEISMDHLTEDPKYYKKLSEMEKADKGKPIKTCSCGHKLTTKNATFIGEQDVSGIPDFEGKRMLLYNCPKCDSTVTYLEDKLEKGAVQRIAPYNPKEEEETQGINPVYNWVVESDTEERERIPRMTGAARLRGLRKIGAKTQVRKNQNGELEFLLHRGMSTAETQKHQNGQVDSKTSWTPEFAVAHEFIRKLPDHHVVSAWVPEKHMHSVPKMLGHDNEIKELGFEDEVIVNPHKTQIENIRSPDEAFAHKTKGMNLDWMGLKDAKKFYGKQGVQDKIKANMAGRKSLAKSLDIEAENKRIAENKKSPEASKEHKFKPAKWTHPNGHPRCLICGDEERIGGYCKPSSLRKSDGVKHVATIAVINPKTGSILMGKRRDSGLWTTPGGHLEMGEHPGEGAKRELLEEAGVAADKLKYLGGNHVTSRDGKPLMIHCFVYEGMPKTTSKNDPDKEVSHWTWIPTKDGLPEHVASNLHAPKNVLLQKLGLQNAEALEKAARKKPIQERSYVAAARKPLKVASPVQDKPERATAEIQAELHNRIAKQPKPPSIMSQIEQSKRPVTPIATDESMYDTGPELAGTGPAMTSLFSEKSGVGSTVAGGHKRNLDYDENPDLVLDKRHIHKNWKGHADHLIDGLQPDTGFIKTDTITRGIRIANNTKAGHKTLLKPELGIEDYERVNDDVNPHFLDPNFTSAHREAAYHKIASEFFGLGEHVPATTVFKHPNEGVLYSAQEFIPGARPFYELNNHDYDSPEATEWLHQHNGKHRLQQLAIMNSVLGNNDRHPGNVLIGSDNKLKMIDHGLTFDYGHLGHNSRPAYISATEDHKLEPETINWVKKMTQKQLATKMTEAGVPANLTAMAVRRLEELKNSIKQNPQESLERLRQKMQLHMFQPGSHDIPRSKDEISSLKRRRNLL